MADSDRFQVIKNTEAGRFEVRLGEHVAFAEYRLLKTGILFPHTEVPPAFEGQGVGSLLVRTALDYARAHNQPVMPVCPFFASYIKRHAEYQDLLHPDYRKSLGLD
ncbi:MAG: GNAT family N-acetyltransferase [Phenylobacterium sp.]|uniref:GNAT family N-acetyltransferase n=1 Tax=Phenylobacterium sp. TaxID=1871053 RepID=UPI002724CBED|nr:GNAT family N-acetyltransferase [Phenylobacterium sp.]MDO8899905.1 GNAT family N-acetyltransferase [Phenylobacterium sp.]MDP2214009.1 GNAT family N-acetyltransferase [Phenylobacterium sp.]